MTLLSQHGLQRAITLIKVRTASIAGAVQEIGIACTAGMIASVHSQFL